jgi:hypothetical protein
MNAAVGPLRTCPSTSGETATTGARAAASALAHPGHRQDRPDRDHRIGRADDDHVGRGDRVERLGHRRARSAPA